MLRAGRLRSPAPPAAWSRRACRPPRRRVYERGRRPAGGGPLPPGRPPACRRRTLLPRPGPARAGRRHLGGGRAACCRPRSSSPVVAPLSSTPAGWPPRPCRPCPRRPVGGPARSGAAPATAASHPRAVRRPSHRRLRFAGEGAAGDPEQALPGCPPGERSHVSSTSALAAADAVGRHDLAARVLAASHRAGTPGAGARWRAWATPVPGRHHRHPGQRRRHGRPGQHQRRSGRSRMMRRRAPQGPPRRNRRLPFQITPLPADPAPGPQSPARTSGAPSGPARPRRGPARPRRNRWPQPGLPRRDRSPLVATPMPARDHGATHGACGPGRDRQPRTGRSLPDLFVRFAADSVPAALAFAGATADTASGPADGGQRQPSGYRCRVSRVDGSVWVGLGEQAPATVAAELAVALGGAIVRLSDGLPDRPAGPARSRPGAGRRERAATGPPAVARLDADARPASRPARCRDRGGDRPAGSPGRSSGGWQRAQAD